MNLLLPLKQMIRKEFTQAFRDPKMRRLLLVTPLIQMLLFGYVISMDVNHVPIAIYDLDNSPASRDLITRFTRSKYFDPKVNLAADRQVTEIMNGTKAQAVLRIDHGFGQTLAEGQAAPAQLILDGSDSNSSSIILNYASEIASSYNQEIEVKAITRRFGRPPPASGILLKLRAWFNENLDTRNFFLPGMIALIVLQTTMTMASMAIVREREIGTMEQILVTPITRLEFLLGKMIPFSAIALFDATIVSLVAVFWFKVPFRGSIPLLFAGTILYLFCTLGVGLLVSTISHTQQQAMMGGFLFNNPFMLLSGFTFPIENMPPVVQGITYLNPLRYFLVILRGIFLKGVGFSILWPQYAGLALLGSGILAFSVKRFHKTAG